MKIKVKKIQADAIVPTYAYESDAGFDLFSVEEIIITAGKWATIPTGLALEIPLGYVGLVWDKSGLSFKNGLKSLGGVIDAGYRGEIKICLVNLSKEDCFLPKGSKVAQILIQPVVQADFEEVANLADSSRGEKGFGSSGS